MSVKLGIIGAGMMGNIHADSAKTLGLNIGGITDINKETAKNLARKMDCSFVTINPQKLIESDLIDAVISVPNRLHKPLAISALQCGKDVLLEKPMALDQKECQEINLVATKSGCILQVGFVCRYCTKVATSKRLSKTTFKFCTSCRNP